MVNRIWQHHFGEGIVRTPSSFGKMGDKPSHPELLDWLAVEFVERGWSIKEMHRLMMTSQAYQMASTDNAANLAIDPENRMFWRMPRQRLEGEIIRDQVLAVAGTLNKELGGPNVFPYIDPDLFEKSSKRDWPGKAGRRPVDVAAQPVCLLETQHPLSVLRDLRPAEPRQLGRPPQPFDGRAAGADHDEQLVDGPAGEEVRRAAHPRRRRPTRRRKSSAGSSWRWDAIPTQSS